MTRTTTSPTLLVVVTLLLGWKSLAVEDQPHLRRPSNQHHHGVTEEEHTTTTTTTTSDKNRRPATLTLDPHNLHWSSASNGHILLQGVPFHVRGISWSGVEWKETMFHGLNVTSLDSIADFVASRFNVIRLPFSVQYALADPHATLHNSSHVSFGLEGKSTWEIFDMVVDAMEKRGVLVILDLHLLDNSVGFAELWYDGTYTEADTLRAWHNMLNRYNDRWNVFAVDIKNEPHGIASWGNKNISTDYNRFYERAIDNLAASFPSWKGLYLVEGVQFNQDCDPGDCTKYPEWWGGGFDGAKKWPIRTSSSDANTRLVYSPHVYGPSVYLQPYLNDAKFPYNLPAVWEEMYGWMVPRLKHGIIIGEWGGTYEGKDRVTLDLLADWLKDKCMTNTVWWAINPTSGDTGGILESDWKTANKNKMDLLDKVQPSFSQLWWEDGHLLFYPGVPSDAKACDGVKH